MGSLKSLAIPQTPCNQRGRAWSATQSPGLRPITMSILGGAREISLHQMACHFPSLPISGLSLSSDKYQMIDEQKTIKFSHLSVPQDLHKGSKWKWDAI